MTFRWPFLLAACSLTMPALPQAVVTVPHLHAEAVPAYWRGHNLAASTPTAWMQFTGFDSLLSALRPGIIRWPFGNRANNYRWYEHLHDTDVLNFPQAVARFHRRGIPLQVVVNFGNGMPGEAAEWVRFCNSHAPRYQALRDSLLGDSTALGIRIWEIGNESTDGWTFAWSWLGYQDTIFGRHRAVIATPRKVEADSMYYYGGAVWRRGWVKVVGGLTPLTAILGEVKRYSTGRPADTLAVAYPFLDTTNAHAVTVYRTPGVDAAWLKSQASPAILYDSLTRPANRLAPSEYAWDDRHVFLHPTGGLAADDVILIEYRSIGHRGAFEFRDSMKAADPTIRIGYSVKITPELEHLPRFAADFSAHPPDFMVRHPYASNITLPALAKGALGAAAYAAEFKVRQLAAEAADWHRRTTQWNLSHTPRLGITEWNIALWDESPDTHTVKGVAGALYVVDYWARLVQHALHDSIALEVVNHFGLMASGDNFIHLLHVRPSAALVKPSAEGMGVMMLMEMWAGGMLPVNATHIPPMTIPWKGDSSGPPTPRTVDALVAYAGRSTDGTRLHVMVLNRDPDSAHSLKVIAPSGVAVDSVDGVVLVDTLAPTRRSARLLSLPPSAPSPPFSFTIPPYSIALIRLHLSTPAASSLPSRHSFFIAPNPTDGRLRITHPAGSGTLTIHTLTGRRLLTLPLTSPSATMDIRHLPPGTYIAVIRQGETIHRLRVIKK